MSQLGSMDAVSLDGVNILIADDEELNFILLKEYLEGTGANILYAKNGEEAISIFKSKPVDLILMDIRMPVMTGAEAARQIKTISAVPILAVSAFMQSIERESEKYFDEYIEKPVDQQNLLRHITSFTSK